MIDLRLGDSAKVLGTLDEASIDLVLTSPPYDGLRVYGGHPPFDFDQVAAELVRVLRPGGVLVWIVGDQTKRGTESGTSFRHALGFLDRGLNLHDTMIYRKLNPKPTKGKRYGQAFEYMFVMSKGEPTTFNPLEVPCKTGGKVQRFGDRRPELGERHRYERRLTRQTRPRYNVWDYPVAVERFGDHPAIFPLALAIDHVLSWSNPGDVVLDPFLGSGTSAIAASRTGRRFVGVEIHETYLDVARHRINTHLRALDLDQVEAPVRPKRVRLHARP